MTTRFRGGSGYDPEVVRRMMRIAKTSTSRRELEKVEQWAASWNKGGDVWVDDDKSKHGIIWVISERLRAMDTKRNPSSLLPASWKTAMVRRLPNGQVQVKFTRGGRR